MSEFIKVTMKRREPINLVIGKLRSTEEWKAEEKEHLISMSDITAITHEYENVYQITVANSPLTKEENEIFKLVSSDSRLRDL